MADRRPPAAKRQTLFPKIGARVNLQPQSMAQNFIEVRNETQLHAALGSLPGAQGNCYGKGISIVAPIVLTEALTLNATLHAGLTLTSPGRASIEANGFALTIPAADVVVSSLSFSDLGTFTISGARVGVSGITLDECRGFSINATDVQITDIPLMSASAAVIAFSLVGGSRTTISNVVLSAGAGTFTAAIEVNGGACWFTGVIISTSIPLVTIGGLGAGAGTTVSNCRGGNVTVSGFGWFVTGNRLGGNITGDGLSESCAIYGNVLGNGNIDMSAGVGNNTIVANVNTNVITGGAGDAIVGNT